MFWSVIAHFLTSHVTRHTSHPLPNTHHFLLNTQQGIAAGAILSLEVEDYLIGLCDMSNELVRAASSPLITQY
jgi:Translin family